MVNLTQKQFVIERLNMTGEVSRNDCLKNYISRLGAIIASLKKEGWKFETFYKETIKPNGTKGKDFIYREIKQPLFQ